MKAIVIDDERAMHLIMTRMIGKLPDLEIAGCFSDPAAAEAFIEANDVQLAFTDIGMPQESGIRFARRMAERHPSLAFVFVTSHKDYALDAFELSALDYIVKPVSLERVGRAVNRAMAVQRFAGTAQGEKKTAPVQVYALGGLEVVTAQGGVSWRSRKSAELFGYLLLHNGRMVSRAKIVGDLFGDMPARNADTYLNTAVYQLRKALEPHGLKAVIQSEPDGYGIKPDNGWRIDFVEFEDRLKRHAEIDDTNLERALDAEKRYAGGLFGERGYGWALNETERLSRLYAAFAKRLSAALLDRDQADAAIPVLRKLFDRNDLDEETAGLLLRAYAVKKDRESFMKLYRGYAKRIRKELHVDPSEELERLYARLQTAFRAG